MVTTSADKWWSKFQIITGHSAPLELLAGLLLLWWCCYRGQVGIVFWLASWSHYAHSKVTDTYKGASMCFPSIFKPYISINYLTLYGFTQCSQQNFELISRPESSHCLHAEHYKNAQCYKLQTTWFTTMIFLQKHLFPVCSEVFISCVNTGKRKAFLTFSIMSPEPSSVMHAKCCLWVTTRGTTSRSVFEKGPLTVKLVKQTAAEEIQP